jgi:hypothetical protein
MDTDLLGDAQKAVDAEVLATVPHSTPSSSDSGTKKSQPGYQRSADNADLATQTKNFADEKRVNGGERRAEVLGGMATVVGTAALIVAAPAIVRGIASLLPRAAPEFMPMDVPAATKEILMPGEPVRASGTLVGRDILPTNPRLEKTAFGEALDKAGEWLELFERMGKK